MKLFAKYSAGWSEVQRFLRSYAGGVVYFWTGYAVFAILYTGFGWDWLYAKIVCDIVGFSLNYLVQRYWAFKDVANKQNERKMAGKYLVVSALGIGLDYAIIAGLKALDISPYFGFFVSSGFMTIWNYAWYRFWVFYTRKKRGKYGRKH